MDSLINVCEMPISLSLSSVSSVPPSAAVTHEWVRTEKAHRNPEIARLSTLKFVPRIGSFRRLAVYPREDPTSFHFWTSSGGCRDRHAPFI